MIFIIIAQTHSGMGGGRLFHFIQHLELAEEHNSIKEIGA